MKTSLKIERFANKIIRKSISRKSSRVRASFKIPLDFQQPSESKKNCIRERLRVSP